MKKIIFVLLTLVSTVVIGQTVPGYTPVNDRYIHEGLAPKAIDVPAGTTPVLRTGQWTRAGALFYDSTGTNHGVHAYDSIWRRLPFDSELLDSVWRISGKDTIFWRKAGVTFAVKDSAGSTIDTSDFAIIDTTGRTDSSMLYWDSTNRVYKHIDFDDVGGSGEGIPGGSNTYIQFNRSNAFAGVDSLTWIANGINIKGRYMTDGASVIYRPDQTNFLNSIFYGSLPASLSHTTGITGQYNTGVGLLALNANTTGASNFAGGSRSLQANTTGNNNVGVGDGALITNTSGSNNTAVGMAAAPTNSTASNITAIGFEALRMTTAGNNTAGGWRALHENTSGVDNTGWGVDAGYQNQTGSRNTYAGSGAGTGSGGSSNSDNSGFGYRALFGITTGRANIAFGDSAAINVTSASRTITIGNNVNALSATEFNTVNFANVWYATGASGTGTTPAGNMGIGVTAPTEKLDVDGQVRIRTVNAAAVTSVDSVVVMEDGKIKSVAFGRGTWTPTGTAGANVSSLANITGEYTRIGDEVTFTIYIQVTPTAGAAACVFDLSLPIASNFTNQFDGKATGSAIYAGSNEVAQAYANTTDDRLTVSTSTIGSTNARDVVITGHYQIK